MNEFEKDLRKKLDKLSDSVDCFDKIVKKAYSDDEGFYEDDFTVASLENVTYQKKRFRFAPVMAVVLVAVTLFLVPKLKLGNLFSFNTGKSSIERYADLMDELEYELSEYNYVYSDYKMDDFNHLALFINPLYNYQYDNKNTENLYVRVYTKLLTNDKTSGDNTSYQTNQIYLVEYKDFYSEENIISIIDSKAKFNHDDIEECTNKINADFQSSTNNINQNFVDFLNINFVPNESNNTSLMYNDNIVAASSFNYKSFYKLNGNIYPLLTETLVINLTNSYCFNYQINCSYMNNEGKYVDFDTSWLTNQWNKIGYNSKDADSNLIINKNSTLVTDKNVFNNNTQSDKNTPIIEHGYTYENSSPTILKDNLIIYRYNTDTSTEYTSTEYIIPTIASEFTTYIFSEGDNIKNITFSDYSYTKLQNTKLYAFMISKNSNNNILLDIENNNNHDKSSESVDVQVELDKLNEDAQAELDKLKEMENIQNEMTID